MIPTPLGSPIARWSRMPGFELGLERDLLRPGAPLVIDDARMRRASEVLRGRGTRVKWLTRILGIAGLALVLSACALTPQQIFERSAPAIVRIEARSQEGDALGTGFAISERRIATNLHVIDGAEEAFIQLVDGSRFRVRRVIAYDELQDLAILETAARGFSPLRLAESDELKQGERIYAIGNPLGLDYTITEGLFSGRRRFRNAGDLELLQVSADLSEGSSGGPLLNERGEVIGIATRVLRDGGYGLGVPVSALRWLDRMRGQSQPFAEFSGERRERLRELASQFSAPVERKVPRHPPEFFDGCSAEEMEQVRMSIAAAIERGAPVFNAGNPEDCYRIYEGTALRLARQLSEACGDGREALEVGLVRADGLENYGSKAWALRDAFDGLLEVIERRVSEPR